MSASFNHAVRMLARRPLYTAAIVLTLALGIGANTAVFSLVHAVLLRPLPYDEPDRLVMAAYQSADAPVRHDNHGSLTGATVIDWHRHSTVFSSIALVQSWATNLDPRLDLMMPTGAVRLNGSFVTANFFELLGTRAVTGRLFDSRDQETGMPLAVLSDGAWRRYFGADPAIVGRTVDVTQPRAGRVRLTIVGVLPPAFRFTYPRETEVWVTFPWSRVRDTFAAEYQFIGRLAPSAGREQARAELTNLSQDALRRRGVPAADAERRLIRVETLPQHLADDSRPGVLLVAAGAGVVLLIGCINVALLLLALIVDREREMVLRSALGATRWQIVRQLLAESLLLCAAGAGLGVLVAIAVLPPLRSLVPANVPRADEMSVDWLVVGFSAALAIVTAVVSGLAPAWHAQRRDIRMALQRASLSTTADRHVTYWRRAIVTGQVAIVLMLLVGASLLLSSLWQIERVDTGFEARGLIAVEMRLLNPKYAEEGRIEEFQRRVMERVRAMPEVAAATMTTAVPMRGTDFAYMLRPVGGTRRTLANGRTVDPEYFATMRIPLLSGRLFTTGDHARAPAVAIVSAAYARALFADGDAIGRQLEFSPQPVQIIGIVGDVRHEDVKEPPRPAIYFPRTQHENELICVIVQPRSDRDAVVAAVTAAVRDIDPDQPVQYAATLEELLRDNTSEERFFTAATMAFALVAVLLSIAGLAGVVSRGLAERLREVGIRLALGAAPRQLLSRVIVSEMLPVLAGVVLGLAGAWMTSRLIEGFLYEVSPLDPLSYAAAVLLVVPCALFACFIPARRALGLDVATVLRTE